VKDMNKSIEENKFENDYENIYDLDEALNLLNAIEDGRVNKRFIKLVISD
jgi:hypothetical protein